MASMEDPTAPQLHRGRVGGQNGGTLAVTEACLELPAL
jgi:hypothetical protein